MSRPPTVIVGGGIAGLACAYELHKAGAPFLLLEASGRLGGKILSEREGEVVYEGGPDSFITTKPDALELVRELGLENDLLSTNQTRKNVYVYSRGRLRRYPGGMMLMAPTRVGEFLRSDLVPWSAKLRMMLEPLISRGDASRDESIGEFTRRRLGSTALEVIAGPVMAGIYAGDPDRLSLASTFPQFAELEKRHRSLILGLRAKPVAPPKASPGLTMFMTLRSGVSELVRALAARLPASSIRLGARVAAIGRDSVTLEGGEVVPAGALVLAVGADLAGRMTAGLDAELSKHLGRIPFASTATVSLLYSAEGFPLKLDGFGFVVDRRERSAILAATYSSTKFPGRLPPGKVLIRCFLGGAGREDALAGNDAEIAARVRQDLKTILGLDREPEQVRVYRWMKLNPQYNVGHGALLDLIEERRRLIPGLHLVGSSYRGVGIPDCIRSGREAARLIMKD